MTKSVAPALINHLSQEVTTLCTCWTITRTDGLVFRFTDHDQDVILRGYPHVARLGYNSGDAETSAGFSVANIDVTAIMSSESITEDDLTAGLWDYAQILIEAVNYEDPSMGTMVLRSGTLGQVSLGRTSFQTELRGISQAYQQGIVQLYSQKCRAVFGDTKCQVPQNYYAVSGTVTHVESRRQFSVYAPSAADYGIWGSASINNGLVIGVEISGIGFYSYGRVRFETGANASRTMEIKNDEFISGGEHRLTLQLPMTYTIEVGDVITFWPGCSKTISHCMQYLNYMNFRGEPYVPLADTVDKGATK